MTLQGFYTNKGRALAAKIAAGTAALTITRVDAGSGHTADIASATSLPDTEQTLTVGAAAVEGATASLPVTLCEAAAAASYSLTELGVYAADPDEGEILMQVYQLDAAAAIAAGGEGVLRFYLRQSIGAQGVTVVCSGAGIVLDADLDPLREAIARKPDAVMGTMTIHVAKTGSDTTGDGSAAHPFLTIQHAVDLLPKCLQQRVNIAVHAGQYNENVTIVSFFGGGYLKLYGISGETVSIKTLEVVNCSTSMIYLENFSVFDEINAPYNYSIHLENLINVRMESISTTQSVSNQDIGAVYAREVAHFYMYGCTISNKQIALDIGGTIAYLNNTVTGSGNTVGIRCGSGYPYMGGFVQKGGASLGGTEVKEFGGQIW